MIKLEIKNIIDERNYDMPRLELWMVSPRKMLVESSSVIEYITEDEFVSAWKKLNERKVELEDKYNIEHEKPALPLNYKKELKAKVEKLMSKIDEVIKAKEAPRSRVLN